MSKLLALYKPIGIGACICALIQGLSFAVLTILGILTYHCVITIKTINDADVFLYDLVNFYFYNLECADGASTVLLAGVQTPEKVQIWLCVNLGFNVVWTVSSIVYLVGVARTGTSLTACFTWTGVTSCVLILDIATTVVFGLDYGIIMKDLSSTPSTSKPSFPSVAALMFTLAAKGFILWVVNLIFVVILILAGIEKHKESLQRDERLSRQASFVNPTVNAMWPDNVSDTYHQPAHTRDEWDPPTHHETPLYPYSNTPTSASTFGGGYHNIEPVLVLQDPPKGRGNIPSPDYSPPLMHRPILPLRPALRKPPGNIGQIGRTVF